MITVASLPLRRLVTCLDRYRVPLNRAERSDISGEVPYWGAGGIVDFVDRAIFDEPLVLLGEDGAPFFDSNKQVAYSITGRSWINNHIHALRPEAIDGRFLAYALNSVDYSRYITGATRDKLTQDDMMDILVPVPSLDDQRAIADFLDLQIGHLDRAIRLRQQQVSLLAERRDGALSACVGGAPDPGPDIQRRELAAGIRGETVPLKRVLERIAVGVVVNPSDYFTDHGVPFIHGYNVRDGWLDMAEFKMMSAADSFRLARSRLKTGDVLVVRAGYPGRAAVVPAEMDGANCASVLILRCGGDVLPHFVEAFFNSPQGRAQVNAGQYGAAQDVISAGQVSQYAFPRLPLSDQQNRVRDLQEATTHITQMSQLIARQIALLQERRVSLIRTAVTGNLDVGTTRSVA